VGQTLADVEGFGVNSDGPFTNVNAGFAVCDADDDGDLDAYFPLMDDVTRAIHYYQNSVIDHEDLMLFVKSESPMEWDTAVGTSTAIPQMTMVFDINDSSPIQAWANYFKVEIYYQSIFGANIDPAPITIAYFPTTDITNLEAVTFPMEVKAPNYYNAFYYIMLRLVTYDPATHTISRVGPVSSYWFSHGAVMSSLVSQGLIEGGDFQSVSIIYNNPTFPLPNGNDPPGDGVTTPGGPGIGPTELPPTGGTTPVPPPPVP
ncbi:MAG: hypothetical protein ABIK28_04965, partial [Planctomycetota bacterium]